MLSIDERVRMTVACRDTDAIAKVPDAGRVFTRDGQRLQTLHNGLVVVADAYYGPWMTDIITGLSGHHEPQEELVFHALVQAVRPRTTIVELGAFWSYYALWFVTAVGESTALCIEPDAAHLAIGRRNAALNNLSARVAFVQAWAGGSRDAATSRICETSGLPVTLPQFDVPALLDLAPSSAIEVLHIDIQGAELDLLRSLRGHQQRVRFVVVSTHHLLISGSQTTHIDCLAEIEKLGGHVLVTHDVGESFSGDGLIVASFQAADRALPLPKISRNAASRSLFGAS